jgi:hypothetical protein
VMAAVALTACSRRGPPSGDPGAHLRRWPHSALHLGSS